MLTFVLIAKHTPYYLAGHALIVKVEDARAISYGCWLTLHHRYGQKVMPICGQKGVKLKFNEGTA